MYFAARSAKAGGVTESRAPDRSSTGTPVRTNSCTSGGTGPRGHNSQAARCSCTRRSPRNVFAVSRARVSSSIKGTSSAQVTERFIPGKPANQPDLRIDRDLQNRSEIALGGIMNHGWKRRSIVIVEKVADAISESTHARAHSDPSARLVVHFHVHAFTDAIEDRLKILAQMRIS